MMSFERWSLQTDSRLAGEEPRLAQDPCSCVQGEGGAGSDHRSTQCLMLPAVQPLDPSAARQGQAGTGWQEHTEGPPPLPGRLPWDIHSCRGEAGGGPLTAEQVKESQQLHRRICPERATESFWLETDTQKQGRGAANGSRSQHMGKSRMCLAQSRDLRDGMQSALRTHYLRASGHPADVT